MHIYLLAAVPLSFVYVLILRDMAGGSANLIARPALRGTISSLLVALATVFVRRFFERPFSGHGLFFYLGVLDFVLPAAIGVLLYFAFTNSASDYAPDEGLASILAFFAGMLTMQGFFDLFQRDFFGPYELFVAPSMRVSLMLLVSTVYYHFADETFWIRYLYLLLLAIVPFVAATPQLFVALNLLGIGIGLTATLFLGSFACFLFWTGAGGSLRLR